MREIKAFVDMMDNLDKVGFRWPFSETKEYIALKSLANAPKPELISDGWIGFSSEDLPYDRAVEVKFKDGTITKYKHGRHVNWLNSNIIAYRIISEPEEKKECECWELQATNEKNGVKFSKGIWCAVCGREFVNKSQKEPKKQTLIEYIAAHTGVRNSCPTIDISSDMGKILRLISDYFEGIK